MENCVQGRGGGLIQNFLCYLLNFSVNLNYSKKKSIFNNNFTIC